MSTPAGLEYLPQIDGLAVKFFAGEHVPVTCLSQWSNVAHPSGAVLQVNLMWGQDDGRLYSLTIAQASQHVPPAVLRTAAGPPLQPRTNDARWLVPLFAEAAQVGHTLMPVDDGDDSRRIDLLLAKSGRVVGLLIPGDRLPPDTLSE